MDYLKEIGRKRGFGGVLWGGLFLTKKLQRLNEYLLKDEKVIDVLIGCLIGKRSAAQNVGMFFWNVMMLFFRPRTKGILVLTNKRIFFISMLKDEFVDLKHENITGVSIKKGMLGGEIIFNSLGHIIDVADINKQY